MFDLHTILCPTDLSEPSRLAFQLACGLGRDYGAAIVVLHVYPPPVNGAEAVDRARDAHFEEGIVDTLRANTPPHLGAVVRFEVAEGSPAEVILEAGEKCDLIVMGTHGRGGLRRVLMGSVAEHVLQRAPCPVMTVRPAAEVPTQPPPDKLTSPESAELGVGD